MSFRGGNPAQGVITPIVPGSGLPSSTPLDVVPMGGFSTTSTAGNSGGGPILLLAGISTGLYRAHSITVDGAFNVSLFDQPVLSQRLRAHIVNGAPAYQELDGMILSGAVYITTNAAAANTVALNYDVVAFPEIQ